MAEYEAQPPDEQSPLLGHPSSALGSSYQPNRRATGLWHFCTEGTRTYFIILMSTCFVGASDPPFKSAFPQIYKAFLCCQQDAWKCHDKDWCETSSGNSSERQLSDIFQWQSILNAAGGAFSVWIWYWGIWPWIQERRQSPGGKDMTTPLIMSQLGVMLLEVVNTIVAYWAQGQSISTPCFKNLVIFAPVVAFCVGGGPYMYWAMRENIISASVGQPSAPYTSVHHRASLPSDPDSTAPCEVVNERDNVPYQVLNRQTAFVVLPGFSLVAQFLSSKVTKSFLAKNEYSDTAYFRCVVAGLLGFAFGVWILWLLPEIPRPETADVPAGPAPTPPIPDPRSDNTSVNHLGPESTSPPTPEQRISRFRTFLSALGTRTFLVTTIVILSGIARSPLTSSISSNFATRYISRRLNFDTSDVVLLVTVANIFPLALAMILLLITARVAKPEPPTRGPTDGSDDPHSSTSATADATSPSEHEITVSLWQILPPLCLLVLGIIGTIIMSLPRTISLTTESDFSVKVAIFLISAGSTYPVFTEPILAKWSAEDKKPSVFPWQQIINAPFLILGTRLLNWGFQKESSSLPGDDDDISGQGICWTYVGILLVCLFAGFCLVLAASVSRMRR
ncbi:hypothetical protein V8F06_013678 [Rhypophila decipiens]